MFISGIFHLIFLDCWIGGVAQVIESLLCNYKALSSTPVPPKKKKGGI
jgi:hypothetical protein